MANRIYISVIISASNTHRIKLFASKYTFSRVLITSILNNYSLIKIIVRTLIKVIKKMVDRLFIPLNILASNLHKIKVCVSKYTFSRTKGKNVLLNTSIQLKKTHCTNFINQLPIYIESNKLYLNILLQK